MQIAPLPVNENWRLADLASYDILDSEAEKDYDDLIELAAEICNCPVSLITFVDKDRQWFKSVKGLLLKETPRYLSFCSHAILQNDLFIVPDATKDERFADNPLVTGEPNIQFYAGAPLASPAGYNMGTICVIDTQPRQLTPLQQKALTTISHQITRLLELRIKNKIILQNAEERLALKKAVIQQNLYKQEQLNQYIATALHESIAQQLAVCSFYTEMIKTSDNVQALVNLTQEQLQKAIEDIRRMCNEITPYSLKVLPLMNALEEYMEKIAEELPYKLHFNKLPLPVALSEKENIALFRAVENWLNWLKKNPSVKNVYVQISTGPTLTIQIQDDGEAKADSTLRKELLIQNVEGYIEQINGKVMIMQPSSSGNLIAFTLPLVIGQ